MAKTDISNFPWLCSTLSGYYDDCKGDVHNLVTDEEAAEQDIITDDSYGLYGMKLHYYAVSHDLERDKLFGEDQLRWILRSWYFDGYVNSIPPNVRSYQLQGIYGEDLCTIYCGINAFDYFSKYGGPEKNTPDVYDVWKPRIGDIIYMPYNEMFYEIRDVKFFDEAFGLKPHTYTLTCKVYKNDKYTIADNPTLPKDDPIWEVATSGYNATENTHDFLSINHELSAHENSKMIDIIYKPEIPLEERTDIDPFGGW